MTRAALSTLPIVARPPRPRGLVERLLAAMALRRSRRTLGGLDGDRLRDLGLTREDALAEARRSCWNAPDHWLR
jgi:uncharacterized protein YjiS (DUF1127 family)